MFSSERQRMVSSSRLMACSDGNAASTAGSRGFSRGAVAGLAAVLAETALNLVAGDAGEPRAEFGRLAQGAKLSPRGEKSFLRHVFALAHVAGGGIGDGANQ